MPAAAAMGFFCKLARKLLPMTWPLMLKKAQTTSLVNKNQFTASVWFHMIAYLLQEWHMSRCSTRD
jgi:hypothetical protein